MKAVGEMKMKTNESFVDESFVDKSNE